MTANTAERRRIHKLQVARRLVQILVVVYIIAVPAVARYVNYLSARELDKNIEKWDGELQGDALVGLDRVFRAMPDGEIERMDQLVRNRGQVLDYAQEVRGGMWSAEIGELSITDPLAAAESVAASGTAEKVLLISLIFPLIVTLLLGRVFCSWICPVNLLLEFTDKLRKVLRFLELKPRDIRFSRWIKHTLLATGLVLAAFLAMPVLGYVYPPAIVGRELHDLVFGLFDSAEIGEYGFNINGLTWLSLVLVVIMAVEITVSRRWWCRYICPGGALYSLLGAARLVRVRRKKEGCTRCGTCITSCTMGLSPMTDKMGIECDNCGVCISHCSGGVLGYSSCMGRGKEKTPDLAGEAVDEAGGES